jgi:hypothetical protein
VAHNDFDEDSDWTAQAEQVAAAPSRRPQQIALLVAGIALGAAGASAAWFLASRTSAPPAPIASPAAPRPTATPAPAVALAPPVVVAAPASSATVDDEAPPPARTASAAAAASAVRSVPALSAAEVARRKELAWSRFYKRPATCDGNPSADQLIDCANHFIRSKREFDERWRNGTL